MATTDDPASDPGNMAEKTRHLDRFAQLSSERKLHTFEMLHLGAGSHVLDVGCGVGADTLSLAHIVGPSGYVCGVDMDSTAVEEANRRAAAGGVGRWVEHKTADATELPFANDSFDACHSERVFIHLMKPERVFSEMVRVTKPGGWIAVIDGDGGSLSFNSSEVDTERKIALSWARKHNNPYAGRNLYGYFKQQGLIEVQVEVSAGPLFDFELAAYLMKLDDLQERALKAGMVTAEEIKRFRADLERSAAIGTFFGTFNIITVLGRKV